MGDSDVSADQDAYLTTLVRREDRNRFLTGLFAPAEKRDALFALYAFNAEIARIPGSVSEPLLGQIKLQWWRDLIVKMADGGAAPAGHPVAQALAKAMPLLNAAELQALIDAREAELGAPGIAANESSIVATDGMIAALALGVLGVTDSVSLEAARHAAVALGLVRRVSEEDENLSQHVASHIAAARNVRSKVDRRALPVLLWTTLAERALRQPKGRPPRSPVLALVWKAWWGRY